MGEVTFVVGSSSDIGLALLGRLVTLQGLDSIVAHCNSSGARLRNLQTAQSSDVIKMVCADLSSTKGVEDMLDEIEATVGCPKKIVFLQGLPLRYERFTKFDEKFFERDLSVQLGASIAIAKRFAAPMSKVPGARIVFVLSSVTRGIPPKFMSMYTIVKHSQLGLMKALSSEFASTCLTVNAVCPSMTSTRFLDGIPDVVVRMAEGSAPKGRNARPDEVAAAILFLLSEESEYITGVELPVAGGIVA